jgi:RNA polymerase sigma-B factor
MLDVRSRQPVARRAGRSGGRQANRHTVDKQTIRALFERARRAPDAKTRERLVLAHQHLVTYLARKFANRGQPLEDLIQVAYMGLLKAIDRYDPSRGIEFTTYATPTIIGEIKRYFRDHTWSIRVPRRLRELNYKLMRIVQELSQTLGRSPTIQEVADAAGVPFDDVLEAMDVGHAYSLVSIDADPASGDEGHNPALLDAMSQEDRALEHFEDQATLEWALGMLAERPREIVRMRYYEDLSQAEIARRLGISQMHVSRILREALARLRMLVSGPPEALP